MSAAISWRLLLRLAVLVAVLVSALGEEDTTTMDSGVLKELPLRLHSGERIPAWIDSWTAPKELVAWMPYSLAGYDNDGAPVYVFEMGNWKPHKALHELPGASDNQTREIANKYVEQAIYHVLRDGLSNHRRGVAVIIDFNGFNLADYMDPVVVEYFLKVLSYFNLIDSVLDYAFVINMNFAAETFIRLAKPFLGNILDKTELYGPQKSKWLPQILRKIPKNQLPPHYGGEEAWRPVWFGGTGAGQVNSTALGTKI